MIDFHKVSGVPKKVAAGHEDVWFASPGGVYVGDNNGNPRLIAPGIQFGDEIPVGTPVSAGLFYYNRSNKKNYISTAEKWYEIPVGAIPGTGTGGTTIAGNVLIEDGGNYFTSVDVEGTLSEIAEKFPWYFGAQKLLDYNNNVKNLNYSAEKYLTAASTNRPTTGWAIQRKNSANKILGHLVGDDNSFYTRVGDKFLKFASEDFVNNAIKDFGPQIDSIMDDLSGWTINVGDGLVREGTTIKGGIKISIDPDIYNKINDLADAMNNLDYVKRAGDSMTGTLTMRAASGQSSAIIFNSTGSANSHIMLDDPIGQQPAHPALYGGTEFGPTFRLSNLKAGNNIITSYADGSLDFRANGPRLTLGQNSTAAGTKLTIYSNSSQNSVDVITPNSHAPLYVSGANGAFLFKTGEPWGGRQWNSIYAGGNNTSPRNGGLWIGARNGGGQGGDLLQYFLVNSDKTHAAYDLSAGSSVNVGMDPITFGGTARNNTALRIFPAGHLMNWGDGGARNDYVAFHYAQKNAVLVMDGYRGTLNRANPERNNYVRLSVDGLINRSSIKFKNPKRVFDDDALSTVKTVSPEVYTYKHDRKNTPQLGFIIEHGAPEEIVDKEGEAINIYALASYLWRAVQQLAEEVDKLKK